MGNGTCTKRWLWRWRSNPLRRRDDIVEAWVVLAVWTVVVVGGTAAGLVTARAADEVFDRQRAERHPARAELVGDVPKTTTSTRTTSGRTLVRVHWTAPDGTTHTDRTLVASGQRAGAEVPVWLDGRGGLVLEPLSPTEAAIEAGLMGTAAALGVTGIAFGTGALARWRLERRRIDQWGREWDLVGPEWGHKTG